jgi:hypothetical protein
MADARNDPIAELLDIPADYGKPTTTLDWPTVRRALQEAKQYWLASVRPDGRPHVIPIDGH